LSQTHPFRPRPAAAKRIDNGFPAIHRLHHFAYRCRDAEETVRFYEGLLGLPLASVVSHERIPSTGEYRPYLHIFFEMAQGSYIAFFDLFDGKGTAPDPDTPAWVNHLALQVDSREALLEAKARLEAAGVEVLGPTVHGTFDSIYFFDPNGIRLELAWEKAPAEVFERAAATAHEKMAEVLRKYRK
jgi:catechol 2,3-dioxygenase-like lactoylglutathione lyase family enzyme